MPSGKTHDAVTLLLIVPTFALSYAATTNFPVSMTVAAAFLFGGLMFGPDLDTISRQYSRWSIFRMLWYPYRSFFKHRSRWSHGLIFGTLLRVVYFMGILTAAAFLPLLVIAVYFTAETPDAADFAKAWSSLGNSVRVNLGDKFLPAVFFGMWVGAASHTFTDMAGSYVKTGRITEFL